MRVTVCWKWVAVDGAAPDDRWAGVSAADEAALEIALTLAGPDGDVTVVTVGPADSEQELRRACAVGASRAIRVDGRGLTSRDVARAIAPIAAGSDYILCGDYSLDRGTGAVPAFLAAELGVAQALGLVAIDTACVPLRVIRRLDGGRREVLDVGHPAVLSVEGSIARLRRAGLGAVLASTDVPIEVLAGPAPPTEDVVVTPYRPRARTLPPPSGSTLGRVRGILDIDAAPAHGDSIALDPPAAAQQILDQLREWGHLPWDTA